MSKKLLAVGSEFGVATSGSPAIPVSTEPANAHRQASSIILPRGDAVPLTYCAEVVWRWRSLIAATTAVALAMAVLIMIASPSRYTTQALVLFDANPVGNRAGNGVAADTALILSQIELLRAPSVVRLALSQSTAQSDESGVSGVTTDVSDKQIEDFIENLQTARRDQSNVVELKYTDRDPAKASRLLNQLLNTYATFAADAGKSGLRTVEDQVDNRLEAARNSVREAQAELRTFKFQRGIVEREATATTERNSAERAVTAGALAIRARLLAEEVAGPEKRPGDPLGIFGSEVASPRLEAARRELGELQRSSDAAGGETQQRIRALRQEVSSEISSLVDLEKGKVIAELLDLERQELAALQLYSSLRTQMTDVKLAVSVPAVRARVIQYAEPPTKRSNLGLRFILPLALAGGLAAGLGMALLAEAVRKDFRTLNDLWVALGSDTVTVLPHLVEERADKGRPTAKHPPEPSGKGFVAVFRNWVGPRRSTQDAIPMAANRPVLLASSLKNSLSYRDAMVSLHHSLEKVGASAQSKIIAVVSGGHGDGKSSVAVNLASVASAGGRSVLLIDADLRHGGLTEALEWERSSNSSSTPTGSLRPFLIDILKADGAVVSNPAKTEQGFWFCSSGHRGGSRDVSPVSLSRLADVVAAARANYDLVIVDTPAMLSYPDAEIVLSSADAAVFVTRFRWTHQDDARMALAKLLRTGCGQVEVVFNDVPADSPRDRHSRPQRMPPH